MGPMKLEKAKHTASDAALCIMSVAMLAGIDHVTVQMPNQLKKATARELMAILQKDDIQAGIRVDRESLPIRATRDSAAALESLLDRIKGSKKPATLSLATKSEAGKPFCRLTVDGDVLGMLAKALMQQPSLDQVTDFAKLAGQCGMSVEELRGKFKVSIDAQEFQKYTAAATPHPIVSHGVTVSTVIPQPPRTVTP